MAVGAMRAIFDAGLRVPEDISVIGFDGTLLADYYNPKIVTVCQGYEKIARKSIDLLFGMIDLNKPATHELVPFRFKKHRERKLIFDFCLFLRSRAALLHGFN